jgi:hypothetical protein
MNAFRLFLSLALTGLLAGCVTGGVAMSDFDARADFSHYRSFAFHEPLGTNRDNADTLLSQRLKASTARQMQARGFVYDEREPDLLVDFHARVEEHVYSNPSYYSPFGYYGYGRRGFYPGPGWGLGLSFGDDYDTYRQGRLNIDVIDARQRKLVWESVVNTNAVRSTGPRAEAMVDAAVASAFRRFPVTAPVVLPAAQ